MCTIRPRQFDFDPAGHFFQILGKKNKLVGVAMCACALANNLPGPLVRLCQALQVCCVMTTSFAWPSILLNTFISLGVFLCLCVLCIVYILRHALSTVYIGALWFN